jgi:polysaccharide export outer membrane protein
MMTRLCLATLLLVSSCALFGQQAPGTFAERDPRYRLQPNDTIEVQYRYTPEYNQTASVQPDGFVSLQLIGDLKLAGMTLDQARAAILTRASTRLRDPEIAIFLKDYEKPHVTVGGEVRNPGRFELHGTLTAIEAIELAGGFNSASAKNSQVILFRRVNSEFAETKLLNLKHAINTQTLAEDIALRPGDMLVVPQNKLSKVERFVRWANIGVYPGIK